MPPHVASPWRLLGAALAERRRALARLEVPIECTGMTHRLHYDGRAFFAPDHDEAGEAALRALGGVDPPCIRTVSAAGAATTPQWWATFDRPAPRSAEVHQDLRLLPESFRRTLLASALKDEFTPAAVPVQDAVAQVAFAVLGEGSVEALRTKFQRTREFPTWDPGSGPWSDKELVLLARCLRGAAGESRPHLVLLPTDPLARQAVAKYVAAQLDAERFLTDADLRTALSRIHRNVKALTALLLAEGLLVERNGQYRVRVRAPRRARNGR